jgi:hypothetical protein
VVERAEDAPADLVPGSLADRLIPDEMDGEPIRSEEGNPNLPIG